MTSIIVVFVIIAVALLYWYRQEILSNIGLSQNKQGFMAGGIANPYAKWNIVKSSVY